MIYRGAGDWGPGKGSNLTPAEVDGNFWEIEQRLAALEAYAGGADTISNVTISGSVLTVHTAAGGEFSVVLSIPRIAASSTVSVTAYELVLGDANKLLVFSNAAGCALNIPDEATVDLALDTEIHILQYGAAAVSIGADSAVVVSCPTSFGLASAEQGAVVTLKKIGPDEWIAFGQLAAA